MRKFSVECPDKSQVSLGKVNLLLLKISLATPLFGGGCKAGENDAVTPIRGASIRGQLRFWWRATRGAAFSDVKSLREKEAEIWGSTSNPSPVAIAVKDLNSLKSEKWAEYKKAKNEIRGVESTPDPKTSFHPYVLFPFRGETKLVDSCRFVETPPSMALWTASFTLAVSGPKNILDEEVAPALWAWINFGGLGARTRRGCGALYCADYSPDAESAKAIAGWYKKKIDDFKITTNVVRDWPTLPSEFLHKNPSETMDAWHSVVDLLFKFRQGPNVGRNGMRGRSRWPEADTLRRIAKRKGITIVERHKDTITGDTDGFPRAEFGLPIVFESRQEKAINATLNPVHGDSTRMASPLILKPLAISPTQAIPMIARLSTPVLPSVKLDKGGQYGVDAIRNKLFVEYIVVNDTKKLSESPMKNRSNGSALEAFIAFAREKGFK